MTGAYGIEEVPRSTPGALICGSCGRAWTEDITPAGRCPWEAEHDEPKPAPLAPEDHDARMVVARNVARFYIGDSAWAHIIVGAYLNPERSQRVLDEEMAE
ncbi:hypothetical protein QDA11_gp11 [Microbacterium phage Jayden]|uniref:Uncharacterized protein n=1 Tax=Microbacterium phage Jayden TaxID=2656550 RepID=A0A649VSJ7_9CAUD|nr:hypothetical protein QDA11_gp11 [Microbacterium phage Jayden]QGJ95231.1 hypothetical protein PBI_JAYDEN_11 [Microbacterium phage Jayden]